MSRSEYIYHRVIIWLVLLILALPLVATLLYALATEWGATILPDGFTLKWMAQLWQDPRFLLALWHSLLICFGALLFSLVLVLPVMFVIAYYFPKLDVVMNVLILLPFAIPPVVSSVGLLQLYSAPPLMLTGSPWILIGCYFTIALPFIWRAISNNMQAINIRELIDAAHLLGATTWQAALMVVLPNLRKGALIAVLLSFSFLIGEFVFANLLVGTNYETLQVYLYNVRNASGHFSSALVISYFFVVLLVTWLANALNRERG
ncbi:ABC transporter permease [Erwinia mallotivora]|uniref:ABC transporter permease n=1 Tax=Erwinia mallotivora TaxID=69222 RepID=A0A014NRK3_9GAMM|nr:ABC transporter permease [Erwinia mallotivora]EXU76480.1 ABC transporter permease [Erwinia mallotivora]